jgi:molybdopterin molybdotransferase
MISVIEASDIFQKHLKLKPLGLSSAIRADRDYPPFHRVMMDGIALSLNDYQSGQREFIIAGIQAAGEQALNLDDKKTCLEVMTGAPLPYGADLVIPYEHVKISSGKARVIVESERKLFDNVHLKGSDCQAGEIVLNEEATLIGPHQGIAASMGSTFNLHQGSRILLVSTGLELVEISEKPLEHQIRRSNVYALKTSLELRGFQFVDMNHLPDDADVIAKHYQSVVAKYDILIYSGGVSKGKFDFLPNVWRDLGVQCHFHEVAQRPGKPLWFGTDKNFHTTIIGLPGNPVSSLVCLHRYVLGDKPLFVKLATDVFFKKELTYFLPARLESKNDGHLWATPSEIKNSGEFTALAQTHGFLELPASISHFEKSHVFPFWTWRPFL